MIEEFAKRFIREGNLRFGFSGKLLNEGMFELLCGFEVIEGVMILFEQTVAV